MKVNAMKEMEQNQADIRWIKNTVFAHFLIMLPEDDDINLGPAMGRCGDPGYS
ncbi:MAG: hypothetical protein ACQEUN_00470 [Pseudomonadota bacterium]